MRRAGEPASVAISQLPPRPNLLVMSPHLATLPAISLDSGTVAGLAEGVPGLLGDLRSDHAGETGAVAIYLGILAISRDA
jgi:hypothetical protein